jgi:hypothetical protein
MTIPERPKLYHIIHIDRLPSIALSGALLCDAAMAKRAPAGTTIGMASIKRRRLEELTLNSHPGLHVGECVPFYFCPRSIMLYLLHRANHAELTFHGGQDPIVHLEADLQTVVNWAEQAGRRWAFTLSNAGAYYFEDRADLAQLGEVNWNAVSTQRWSGSEIDASVKEGKQAEFLVEKDFPWHLIERVGVRVSTTYHQAVNCIASQAHRPSVQMKPDWYY